MPSSSQGSDTRSVVLLGATLTGNRGAESMLRAAVQRLPEFAGDVRFTLLSLYPQADLAENDDPHLAIQSLRPRQMVLVAFPLALLAGVLRRLRLPYRFLLGRGALRSLSEADLVIDLSGISFVDGRGLILVYNALVILLPRLLGAPLLKYSQAMGPFHRPLNRWTARWLLPKVQRIAARGRVTESHLRSLNLPSGLVRRCADAAFAKRIGPQAQARAAQLANHAAFERPVVAVSASSVVDGLCAKHGLDYRAELACFIDWLIAEKDYGVLLLAHSARPGTQSAKNNDLPVCADVLNRVTSAKRCFYPAEALNAETLRALIGRCRILVASRFHAMISGLAMKVPTLLVGWSHKYAEVLADFELEGYALDYAGLRQAALRELFERVEREETDIRARIAAALPGVVQSSLDNARLAAELLGYPVHPASASKAVEGVPSAGAEAVRV